MTTPGSERRRSLSSERRATAYGADERRSGERLREHDGDESRLPAREPPDVVEHGIGAAFHRLQGFDARPAIREVEPAPARIGGGAAGHRERGSGGTCGRRSGRRTTRHGVSPDPAPRRRRRLCSSPDRSTEPPPCPPGAVARRRGNGGSRRGRRGQRDRDRHHPGALGGLRLDHEQCHEAGRRPPRARARRLAAAPGSLPARQNCTIPACDSVNAVKTPIT